MKVAEVINGVVKSFPPFWTDVSEIPEDVINIYFNAPDEVQEGWLFDGKTFTEPPVQETVISESTMTVEQAMSIIISQMSGLEISSEKKAQALEIIAKASGINIL